jgi:trans-aconitate methyltransferase
MKAPSERIISLYEENAAAWDRQRGRDLFEEPWLARFADAVPHGASILDLGCGMGEPIGAYLISRGFALTGVDSSPSLIELCRRRFPAHRWIAGDMRGLRLEQRFDGLIAWHSFFHLAPEPQRLMFPRFAAHLQPGGMLMFTSGPAAAETTGSWQGEALYEASLAPNEYRQLLAANGFTVVAHVVEDPDCGHATVWLARRDAEPIDLALAATRRAVSGPAGGR